MQFLALLVVSVDIILEFVESLSAVLVVLVVVVFIGLAVVVVLAPAHPLVLGVVDVALGVDVHIVDVQVVLQHLV